MPPPGFNGINYLFDNQVFKQGSGRKSRRRGSPPGSVLGLLQYLKFK